MSDLLFIPSAPAHRDSTRNVRSLVAEPMLPIDLAERLRAAVQALPDVDFFCPNWPRYRYVAASTHHIIFAFAIGMNTFAFRLGYRFRPLALSAGGKAYDECGDEWVSFEPFPDGGTPADFEFWAARAYDYAREIGT